MLLYLPATRVNQLPAAYVAAPGDQPVGGMLNDAPKRYFTDEAELISYARRQTQTIGYVDKAEAWIRLEEPGLLILGERHNEVVLTDVANALGTKRFRCEGWYELPVWLRAIGQDQARLTPAQQHAWTTLADDPGNAGEDFLPALWRGVEAFDMRPARDDDEVSGIDAALVAADMREEWLLLYWLIFVASVAATGFPALYRAYDAYKDVLDLFLAKNVSRVKDAPAATNARDAGRAWAGAQVWGDDRGKRLEAALMALQGALRAEVPGQQGVHAGYKLFDQHWRKATEGPGSEEEYESEFMRAADKARDFSMYLHILSAVGEKSVLFGFGALHLTRLGPLLSAVPERSQFRSAYTREFIDGQLGLYPQS